MDALWLKGGGSLYDCGTHVSFRGRAKAHLGQRIHPGRHRLSLPSKLRRRLRTGSLGSQCFS